MEQDDLDRREKYLFRRVLGAFEPGTKRGFGDSKVICEFMDSTQYEAGPVQGAGVGG